MTMLYDSLLGIRLGPEMISFSILKGYFSTWVLFFLIFAIMAIECVQNCITYSVELECTVLCKSLLKRPTQLPKAIPKRRLKQNPILHICLITYRVAGNCDKRHLSCICIALIRVIMAVAREEVYTAVISPPPNIYTTLIL